VSVKNKNTEEKWLLPFCIIEDATTGNVMAINTVMKHYEGYIAKLATRKMYDEYGNVHYCVDKTLRDRLEAKLLKTILEFKIASVMAFPVFITVSTVVRSLSRRSR